MKTYVVMISRYAPTVKAMRSAAINRQNLIE